jgi:uncharacterized protein
MEIAEYYFDTYALYELIRGNENYKRFTSGCAIITTRLNLMELYYGLLLKDGEKTAEKYFETLKEYAVDVDDDTIKQAMKMRLAHKGSNLSYVDCIGYAISMRRGIRFLTGDREFQHMPNVEYVK